MNARQGGLLAVLLATLLAAFWPTAEEEPAVVGAVKRPAASRAAAATAATAAAPANAPRFEAAMTADLFPSQSWRPPSPKPAPPPPPPPPPPPAAPPLPFVYLGKMLEAGKVTVFLAKHGRNYAVREGDVIDATYRVDEVKAPVMTLTYLPLEIRQTMHIGEMR